MKKTLLAGIAALSVFSGSAAHATEPLAGTIPLPRPRPAIAVKVPSQYRGAWCDVDRKFYKRCREREFTEGDMFIGAREFNPSGENTCVPLAIVPMRGKWFYSTHRGYHKIWAVCHQLDSHEEPQREVQYWRLFDNGRTLLPMGVNPDVSRWQNKKEG